ncbi:hypothetical protein SPAR57_1273 [Streptococcus pneumoniae GA19101]|nr:hypothetical protein SPND219_01316 [Streptococcus pneumoniae]AOG56170.1 hypothetical protein SPND122_02207 [Streptococcus pneumoniae]AOG58312.1 hypothetical protein SPND141_02230 [Streptococcus pneumoniae]EHE72795.1 hypothetical protein SPAR59_1369 [Streptococcus pneumoniae GA19690]EHZ35121.1 hypothetical protein SPAR57_1273 [Streptococcus pneumoniae GA19101]
MGSYVFYGNHLKMSLQTHMESNFDFEQPKSAIKFELE